MVYRCDRTHQLCVHGPQKCVGPALSCLPDPRGETASQRLPFLSSALAHLLAPADPAGKGRRRPSPWLLKAGLATRVPGPGAEVTLPSGSRGPWGLVMSQRGEEGITHEACQEGWVSWQSECGLEKNVRTESVSERSEAVESREQSQRELFERSGPTS